MTVVIKAEPWRLVSNVDPAKPIWVGDYSMRELPAEECWPHYDPQYGGECYEKIECKEPSEEARRTAWNSKDRTNLEFLQHEIRKTRSEMRAGIKEYLGMSGEIVEHASGVPGFSPRSCVANGVHNERAWLARLRHQEIHMAEKVQP